MKNMSENQDFRAISDLRAQYSMVKRIADGSFGLVYQMQNKISRAFVAAKRLKHRKPEDVYFSRKEVHILQKITGCPGVVQLIDYFESPAQSVIITEYLEGGELFQKISSRDYNLAENIVRILMKQIVYALQFLKENGIIHLDLKPNNIIFVKEDKDDLNIKIIDFGLARDLEDGLDIPISTCGTPEFTSPEVIECGYASHKSDMWSLGVIVYMLVSGGVSPFFSRNCVKLENNIVGGNVDMEHNCLKGVSMEAKNFIRSLLIVSPSDRWSAEQCLKHKWLYAVDLSNPHRSEQGCLETHALRGWLARRRWVKCCSAVRATLRIVRIREEEEDKGTLQDGKRDPSYLSSDKELWLRSSMLINGIYGRWKIAYM